MVNPNLLLQAQVPDVVGSTAKGFGTGSGIVNELSRRKDEAATRDAKGQLKELESIVDGSVQLDSFISAGDAEGAKRFLESRIGAIEARGGDSRHSREALELLNAGDVDSVKNGAQAFINLGMKKGIITGAISDKVGRFRSVSASDGSTKKLDTVTGEVVDLSGPIDPVKRTVDKQTAIDTQTPSGKAKLKALESKAQEADEKKEKALKIKRTALELVNDLLADESGTLSQFGAIDSRTPNVTQSANTASARLEQLSDILTAENLGMMSGVLSETDLKVIANIAGGGLNRKLGDKVALKNLKKLKKMFESESSLSSKESDIDSEIKKLEAELGL